MLLRILGGAGLLMLGYYIGREVGRAHPIREQLKQQREEGEKNEKEENKQIKDTDK